MDVGSVFVTGANRGIGLELVRQLVKLPNPPKYVFATYRDSNTSQDLKAIKDSSKSCEVHMIEMDVRNSQSIQEARQTVQRVVGENGLNLLINNAAALKMEGFPGISDDNMLFHFKTNVLGPIAVLKEFLPLLQKAADCKSTGLSASRALALNISAKGGSISIIDETHPREWFAAFGYRTSKAALNMATRIISQELRDTGILVVLMCPGWVKTDMGTDAGLLEVSDSVSAILKTIPLLNETHHGSFVEITGKPIPF